jgi:hypothetical protein
MSDDAATGQQPESVAGWQQWVLDFMRQLGADHERTLTARASLGHTRGLEGDPVAALVDLEIATDRCVAVLGAEHPTTLVVADMRAYWLAGSGDRAGAVVAYERLWPQAVRVLGPDHLTTVEIRHRYCEFRDWTGNFGGAVEAYEELLAAYTRIHGSDHPTTAAVAAKLEEWRFDVEFFADVARDDAIAEALEESGGEPLSEEQLEAIDDDVEELMDAEQSAADGVVELQGWVDKETRERGPDDPRVLDTRRALAGQKITAGDIDGGLADYEAVIADHIRVLGPTHTQTFEARVNQAFALDHTADGIRARIAALESLVADEISALGPDDPITMTTRRYLAGAQKSAAELESVLADQIRVLGERHNDVWATRQALRRLQPD